MVLLAMSSRESTSIPPITTKPSGRKSMRTTKPTSGSSMSNLKVSGLQRIQLWLK